jgi:hypothetical protein
MAGKMSRLDPSATVIYREHTVLYGFETGCYCFTCRVKNGYLTGLRANMPKHSEWMIGQHIDVIAKYVLKVKPLRIISAGL